MYPMLGVLMNTQFCQTLGQLEIPEALPVAEYDFVNQQASQFAETEKAKWRAFASAWTAVPYRWRAMHEHASDFGKSIAKSSAPEVNERFQQDHDLFVFVTSAVSSLECFFFASYCLASLINSAGFPISNERDLKFYPKDVAKLFQKSFPIDSITSSMSLYVAASELEVLQDLRNVLAHRGTPPRAHFLSTGPEDTPSAIPGNLKQLASSWQYNFTLETGCLDSYRSFIDKALSQLVLDLASFATLRIK
jgi:hypothetical protein